MYDKEDLLFDVVQSFKDNFDTEIAAVNTLKGDSVLDTIPAAAYFVQEAGEESFNFNPFVFFYVSIPNSESIESSSMDNFTITVLVVFQDEANTGFEMVRKLLRYQRAMKAVIENNFAINAGSNRIKVSGIEPVFLKDQDSANMTKTCGIEIQSFIN